jgi:Tfp pilus assembly protein PilV
MRRTELGFSIVDFLIIVALLLIVIGMLGPRLAQSRNRTRNASTSATCATAPVRPAH